MSLSDTEVGIGPEDRDTIFEEFRQSATAARKVGGTGLGLALSRKFIGLHGGRIGHAMRLKKAVETRELR